jgi:hypothetical protein
MTADGRSAISGWTGHPLIIRTVVKLCILLSSWLSPANSYLGCFMYRTSISVVEGTRGDQASLSHTLRWLDTGTYGSVGGFADIYRATLNGKAVVLKRLRVQLTEDTLPDVDQVLVLLIS